MRALAPWRGRRRGQAFGFGHTPAYAALLSLLLLLAGCASLVDADEARLCRSILPALNPSATGLRVLSTQPLGSRRGVKVLYRAEVADNEPVLRSLACGFAAERSGALQSVHLQQVETDAGALGPLRLHLLKRYWLDDLAGSAVDPAPIANADHVPHIPLAAATLLQGLIAALPQMAVYGLLAAAYALVYGLIGRINLAFGDLATVASYGTLIGLIGAGGINALGLSIAAALALALWTSGWHGAFAGRAAFMPIANQRGQVVLIASTGLALFIAEYVRLAQGARVRWTPPLFNAPMGVARSGDFIVATTPMALAVAIIALLAAVGLLYLMRYSRFGRAWRACADDPLAAELMGVSPAGVLLTTFLIASLFAGLGGAVTTLYYGSVTYSGGLLVGLKALIAAILGGIGSVPGAFLGGLLLGVAESLWSAVFPIELRDPAIYALLAIVLVLRPGGLHGTPDLDPRRM